MPIVSPIPMPKAKIHLRLVTIGSICLAFTAASPYVLAQATPMFRLEAKHGPHAVGLKVVEQYDYSRIFQPLIDHLGQPAQSLRAAPEVTQAASTPSSAAIFSPTARCNSSKKTK